MPDLADLLSDDDREALEGLCDADYLRGHKIEEVDGEWVYCDTQEPTVDGWKDRSCGKCGLPFTLEGHDGCIGTLPDVINACCGHGEVGDAYVQFEDGAGLWGEEAVEYMEPFRDESQADAEETDE